MKEERCNKSKKISPMNMNWTRFLSLLTYICAVSWQHFLGSEGTAITILTLVILLLILIIVCRIRLSQKKKKWKSDSSFSPFLLLFALSPTLAGMLVFCSTIYSLGCLEWGNNPRFRPITLDLVEGGFIRD